MLREVYNFLWFPALPFALVAARPRSLSDIRERLGRGEFPDTAGAPRIWIHAASVGEIEAIRPIAAGLMQAYPGAVIAITTMTAAGREAARRRIPNASACLLAPLDTRQAVRRFLRRVRPALVIIAETELWPNYFLESASFGAKIAILNGRLSERSLSRYMQVRGLFEQVLGTASVILTQSQDDARRYMALVSNSKIVVTGNTKIEEKSEAIEEPMRPELMAFASGRQILVAGSTASGEEAVVVGAYRELRKTFPKLALAIAPRHLERIGEVEKVLDDASIGYVKASQLDARSRSGEADVLVLDTMGELRAFYRRAAIAFVGGSLAPGRGGQNPAEPAMHDVPVLIGPYHENQREITTALTRIGGARIVANQRDIVAACTKWLADEEGRIAAGRIAGGAIRSRGGGARLALMQLQALISLD